MVKVCHQMAVPGAHAFGISFVYGGCKGECSFEVLLNEKPMPGSESLSCLRLSEDWKVELDLIYCGAVSEKLFRKVSSELLQISDDCEILYR